MKRPVLAMFVLLLLGCSTLGKVKLCATGEVYEAQGVYGLSGRCVCKEGHVRDADGKGCHVEDATTTTTTTTTTTSTTSTTSTTTTTLPRPQPTPTVPPPAPSPTPCIEAPSMPPGPVDVRGGLKPSSCTNPSENMRCFKDRGDPAIYVEGETACWSYPLLAAYNLNAGHWRQECRGGLCLLCDEAPRGCFDAWGRRYSNDDFTLECFGSDCRQPRYAFSGQYAGICPARTPKTCPTEPPPSDACTLPPMQECGASEGPTGVYGCCTTDKAASGFPNFSPYSPIVEEVQAAEERDGTVARDRDGRVDEDAYVNEIVRRLRAKGLCVTRGGPSDEVGIKGSNGESWQFDIHLGNGRPRKNGYTAYCRPARF